MASRRFFRVIPLVLAFLLCAGALPFPAQSTPTAQAAQPLALPPFALPLLEGQQVKVEVGNLAPSGAATTFWGADAAYINFSVWWWDTGAATTAFLYVDSVPYLMSPAAGSDGVFTNGTLYQVRIQSTNLGLGVHSWYYAFNGPSGSARLPATGSLSNLLVAPVERFLDTGLKLAAQTTLAQAYPGTLTTLREVALAAGQWVDVTMASDWDTTIGYPYQDVNHFIVTPVALTAGDREVFVGASGAQIARYGDTGLFSNNSQPALKQALATRALLLASGLFNASDLRIRMETVDVNGSGYAHPFLTVRLNDASEQAGDGAADGDSLIDLDVWAAGLPAGLNVTMGKHFMDDSVASNDALWNGNNTWISNSDPNSAVGVWPFSSYYNVTAPDGAVTSFVIVESQMRVDATTPHALESFWTDSPMLFDALSSTHDSYLDLRYTWCIPSTILCGSGPVWAVLITFPGAYTVDLTVTDPFGGEDTIGIQFVLRAKTYLRAPMSDVSFLEDVQGSSNLQFYFADDDGFSSIQFNFSVSPAQIHVSRSGSSPLLDFTADQDWCGQGTGYVDATDGVSPLIVQTFNITVNCNNDPPVNAGVPTNISFNEDSTFVLTGLSSRVIDVDGDEITWSYEGTQTHAYVDVANDSMVFSAEPDWSSGEAGNLSIRVGSDWIYVTLYVIVHPVNDPPEVVQSLPSFTIDEDAANATFILSDYFVDKDDASLSAEVTSSAGLVAGYFPPFRQIWFYPVANYSGTSSVRIRVWDAANSTLEGTFAVIVRAVNDPPSITAVEPPGFVTAVEGDAITFVLQATDPDSLVITYTFAVDGVQMGSGFVSSFNWQTGFSSAGRHEVSVTAADDQGAGTTHKWAVQVTDKNRAPTVSVRLPKGENHSAGDQIPLFAEAADLDGDALTFSWSFGGILQPQTGQSINVSFSSAGDYTARVTVSDGKSSASATIILHVSFTLPPPPPPGNNTTAPPNPSPGPDAAVAAVALAAAGIVMAIVRRRRE